MENNARAVTDDSRDKRSPISLESHGGLLIERSNFSLVLSIKLIFFYVTARGSGQKFRRDRSGNIVSEVSAATV